MPMLPLIRRGEPAFDRLPVEERAKLALELLRSLDGEPEPDAAEGRDEKIERRGAEVDADTADTVSLDEPAASPARGRRDR